MAEAAAAAVAWLTSQTGLTIALTTAEAAALATAVELIAVTPCCGGGERRSAHADCVSVEAGGGVES